jgi:hypothetical protein
VSRLVRARARGAFCWLAVVFQLFALVSSLQLSTAAHFVRDVTQLIADGRHQHDDDGDEDDPRHECPAGCPNCHHVHPGAAAAPAAAPAGVSTPPLENDAPEPLAVGGPSADPSLPSVYHPPRA